MTLIIESLCYKIKWYAMQMGLFGERPLSILYQKLLSATYISIRMNHQPT